MWLVAWSSSFSAAKTFYYACWRRPVAGRCASWAFMHAALMTSTCRCSVHPLPLLGHPYPVLRSTTRCQENADLTFVADRFGCLSCICTWKPGFEPPGYTPMATTRAAQATTRAAQATTRPDSTATTRTLPRQTTTNVRAVTVITRNEWNVFEESEYRFFSEGESWGDAERACRSYSGSLASVHGLDEMKFIFKLWGRDPFLQTWLGGQRTRGGWFAWTDRSEWDFDHFADGEPDADGKQNCVAVGHKTLGDKSKWFNRNCDKRLPFVCKRWR